jgi:hypothetical protein
MDAVARPEMDWTFVIRKQRCFCDFRARRMPDVCSTKQGCCLLQVKVEIARVRCTISSHHCRSPTDPDVIVINWCRAHRDPLSLPVLLLIRLIRAGVDGSAAAVGPRGSFRGATP